jgi:DNA-binding FadR family transcriptional regulator
MAIRKLKPLDNLSQVDKIELSLYDYFKNEHFVPGDAIPKEMDLAKALGVSRTAIREALSRFKMLGMIESRKNRGMIITRPDFLLNMERILDPQLLDGNTMKEIFELRLVIEMGIGDILFLKKTKSNLAKLEEIVFREENTTNTIDRIKIDVEFHAMLYTISDNKTIQRFQKMLLPVFDYVDSGLKEKIFKGQKVTNEYISHRVLLETLKNGTHQEFRDKMFSHLKSYFYKI